MNTGKKPFKLLINSTKAMSEDTNDVIEQEVKVEEPSNLDELDYDALKELAVKSQKDIQTLNAQRHHFKDKYEKLAEQSKPEKATEQQDQSNKPATEQPLSREEAILIAKGLEEDEIKQLKRLSEGAKATGETLTLTQALNDPMFLAYKKLKDDEVKSKKASLGSSGSSSSSKKAGPDVSKMTREEHEAYAKKVSGQ